MVWEAIARAIVRQQTAEAARQALLAQEAATQTMAEGPANAVITAPMMKTLVRRQVMARGASGRQECCMEEFAGEAVPQDKKHPMPWGQPPRSATCMVSATLHVI